MVRLSRWLCNWLQRIITEFVSNEIDEKERERFILLDNRFRSERFAIRAVIYEPSPRDIKFLWFSRFLSRNSSTNKFCKFDFNRTESLERCRNTNPCTFTIPLSIWVCLYRAFCSDTLRVLRCHGCLTLLNRNAICRGLSQRSLFNARTRIRAISCNNNMTRPKQTGLMTLHFVVTLWWNHTFLESSTLAILKKELPNEKITENLWLYEGEAACGVIALLCLEYNALRLMEDHSSLI